MAEIYAPDRDIPSSHRDSHTAKWPVILAVLAIIIAVALVFGLWR